MLAKERDLSSSLVDQNRSLLTELESQAENFKFENLRLVASMEQSSQSVTGRIGELEQELVSKQAAVDRLQSELARVSELHQVLEVELKSLRSSVSTKQADFNLQQDRLNREMADATNAKTKVISDQRALIDQLSNSMSEAATQLMDSQNISKFHQSDLEVRDRKITALEEKLDWAQVQTREKMAQIIGLEDASRQLEKRIEQLVREKEVVLSQLETALGDSMGKSAKISQLETERKKFDLIQTNLVSELQSLPIINKRLESDCAFLRDDLKVVAERLKSVLKENEQLLAKSKMVDSILSPEQRSKLTAVAVKPESVAISENKRLQIETMELRMRLVDSQAARDKAQAHLIDQSQLIAKLQRDLKSENGQPLNQ
jgi:chromosome segregation ATPase